MEYQAPICECCHDDRPIGIDGLCKMCSQYVGTVRSENDAEIERLREEQWNLENSEYDRFSLYSCQIMTLMENEGE